MKYIFHRLRMRFVNIKFITILYIDIFITLWNFYFIRYSNVKYCSNVVVIIVYIMYYLASHTNLFWKIRQPKWMKRIEDCVQNSSVAFTKTLHDVDWILPWSLPFSPWSTETRFCLSWINRVASRTDTECHPAGVFRLVAGIVFYIQIQCIDFPATATLGLVDRANLV